MTVSCSGRSVCHSLASRTWWHCAVCGLHTGWRYEKWLWMDQRMKMSVTVSTNYFTLRKRAHPVLGRLWSFCVWWNADANVHLLGSKQLRLRFVSLIQITCVQKVHARNESAAIGTPHALSWDDLNLSWCRMEGGGEGLSALPQSLWHSSMGWESHFLGFA